MTPFVFPWTAGQLSVRRNANGHYTLLDGGRGVATLYGSHDFAVGAAAAAAADYARLRDALERIAKAEDAAEDCTAALACELAGIARAALRGPADATPAEIAATLARVEAGDLTPSAGGAPP